MSVPLYARPAHAGSSRLRAFGVLLVSLVLLAGCKVDARVDVRMNADGSGTVTARVTLDAEAVARVAPQSSLEQAVRLNGLREAGWTVSSWTAASGGGRSLTLTHPFVGQEDLARRLEDLAGADGPLGDPKITHKRSWFGATDSVQINGDLRRLSTGIRSDPEVAAALTNAGVNVDALDAQLQSDLGQSFTLTLAVHAPGGESSEVTLTADKAGAASAQSSEVYTTRIVLMIVGVALLLVAIALTAASLVANSRRRRAS